MSLFNISLIIPTYKRESQVHKIISSIQNQIKNNVRIEILVCDSYSEYNKKKLKIKRKKLTVKYLNIKKNNLSAKRNYGLQKSKYKNIILIDDDCIPKKNFISSYINDFNKIDNKTILSGIVEYPKRYLVKYNHIKYRDSKHFKKDKFFLRNLLPDQIVAMNMAFKKSKFISSLGYFNEKFKGYGFEDHEFAYRYNANGYKLLKSKASIIHDEGQPNIYMYSKKHYHLGRDGMKNLLRINPKLARSTIYYRIEKNLFVKILFYLPYVNKLLSVIEKIIINTDKNPYLNYSFLYDYLRLFSYIRGYIDRKKTKSGFKVDGWYD